MRSDNALEMLMGDLVYAAHVGWASAEFNLVKTGLIEMIQGHAAGLMRKDGNYWCDLRWTLTDRGRRTSAARFQRVMGADPPLWVAERDAEEGAHDYRRLAEELDDPDIHTDRDDEEWVVRHRRMSINLDKRAERIRRKTVMQKTKARRGL
jgi:hypothetical protein